MTDDQLTPAWGRENGPVGEVLASQLSKQESWFRSEFRKKRWRYLITTNVQIVFGGATPILILSEGLSRWFAASSAAVAAIAATYAATHSLAEDRVRIARGLEAIRRIGRRLEVRHAAGLISQDDFVAASEEIEDVVSRDLTDWTSLRQKASGGSLGAGTPSGGAP